MGWPASIEPPQSNVLEKIVELETNLQSLRAQVEDKNLTPFEKCWRSAPRCFDGKHTAMKFAWSAALEWAESNVEGLDLSKGKESQYATSRAEST